MSYRSRSRRESRSSSFILRPSAGRAPHRCASKLVAALLAAALLAGSAVATLAGPDVPTVDRSLEGHDLFLARQLRQAALERDVAMHPKDTLVRMELADVLKERGMISEAIRQLELAAADGEDDASVWQRLAAWYRQRGLVRTEIEYLDHAVDCYATLMDRLDAEQRTILPASTTSGVDEQFAPDLLAGASLAMALGRHETAARLAAALEPLLPDDPQLRLVNVCLAYKSDDLPRAAHTLDLLVKDDRDPWLAHGLAGFDLMHAVTGGRTPADLRSFWKSQDPTPTTVLNERHLEHAFRVLVADALFTRHGMPGRDTHRGSTFVRYGFPDHRGTAGANFEVEFVMRPHGYSDPVSHLEYPKQAWAYRDGDRILSFVFEDRTLQGDFVFTETTRRTKPIYDHEAPTLYVRPVPAGTIPLRTTETHFRGHRHDVIASFASAVPTYRLEAADAPARSDWRDVELRWAVFDTEYNLIAEHAERLAAPEHVYTDASGRTYLLGRADFDLPSGDYIVATEFKDARTGKEGVIKRETVIERQDVMISDVELCRTARTVDPALDRPFVRYDAQVVPNPRNEVATGDPLRFYYEIYGLGRTTDGRRQCRIIHRVRSLNQPKDYNPIFPLAYVLDVDEGVAKYDAFFPRVGELDISSLSPGRYELQVLVEDLTTGRSERRRLPFRVLR